ncbi:MAG TPA: glycosyltransferase family 87 protein [Rhizomicrobium sp.]
MATSIKSRRFGEILAHGEFLTRARIRLWAGGIAIGWLAAILCLALTAHGLNDYAGRPLGSDFSNVYAAGTLAREGQAQAPFDPALQHAREQAIFGEKTPFYGWHYPPYFLFVADALAALPYIPALVLWQGASFALYLFALSRLTRAGPAPRLRADPNWLLLAAAFPAVFINFTHGHNGFLTAALFAGALAALETRPILAGILFGLTIYKPQFGVLLPFALIAGGYWRTAIATAATVIVFTLVVTLAFGSEVWPAFLASTHFTRTVVLEAGGAGWFKIQSAFSLVRMWGGSVALAYAVQGAVAAGIVAVIIRVWSSTSGFAPKAALLCMGSFLATPYSLDYDMMILAPAILLLIADIYTHPAPPYRAAAVALLWLVPFFTRGIAALGIPVGMISVLAVFVLVARQEWTAQTMASNEPTFA